MEHSSQFHLLKFLNILKARIIWLFLASLVAVESNFAQAPKKPDAAEIYAALQKLQVLGSVLYVAAHPDDENTRLISYFSNAKNYHVCYLSLTRGDGGQNLIGPEIREQLGIIRTQELLAARDLDGGQQMFSRANDFGYSKHPDETLRIWESEEILSDVVWAIRSQRPDIIVNRFDHRSPGRTHGHHTSSAMLSVDAFDLSNSTESFPEQLEWKDPWQATRLFFNTSWWFYGSQEKFEAADKSNMIEIDAGVYLPVLGLSNNEIAAYSRSMHKSQGFGSSTSRGTQPEYIELIKGATPNVMEDPFEGVNTTWSRIDGGEHIGIQLAEIEKAFDFTKPSASVPALIEVYNAIEALPDDGFWKPKKLAECKQLVYWLCGAYIEASTSRKFAVAGDDFTLKLEALNRSGIDVDLITYKLSTWNADTMASIELGENIRWQHEHRVEIPADIQLSNPYWLDEPGSLGMYFVPDQSLRGQPENNSALKLKYTLQVHGTRLAFETDVVYKSSDPVIGEVYKPFFIYPDLAVSSDQNVYILPAGESQTLSIALDAFADKIEGTLHLILPDGWTASPSTFEIVAEKNDKLDLPCTISSPIGGGEADLGFEFVSSSGKKVVYESIDIDYDHIPQQHLIKPAIRKLVSIDVKRGGERIGYVMGAGDEIPECLEAVGYSVELLDEGDMRPEKLSQYDAIVSGIRAYNTIERMPFYEDALMEYVENGGTYIAQYNTNRRLKVDQMGPYPFKISRDRVTVEEAEVRMLQEGHPLFNYPNKITSTDFDQWVQERGLYFANEWDDAYTTLLSSNDPGQEPTEGGLLLAEHGKGIFVYSGYSWFRQLPAAVPGAYRLFCNLLALKQENP